MLNLKEMSLEELTALAAEVKKEIAARGPQSPELVLYTHSCKGAAKHHLGKYKHWAKRLTGVDATKTNGYAFLGDFLYVGNEHKIPTGSIVVEVCGADLSVYEVTGDGKMLLDSGSTKSASGIIDRLAARF